MEMVPLDAAVTLQLGALTFDPARAELRARSGAMVPLRRQAMDVLLALAQQAGHVVSREELLRLVWPQVVVGDDSLVQAVAEIRRVLKDRDHCLVRTVARRGYMLVPDAAGSPTSVRRPDRATSTRAVAATLCAAALVIALQRDAAGPPPGVTAALPSRSLVVLPLAVEDDQSDQTWFADNLTADLTTSLSKWQDVAVIGRGTAQRYRGKTTDPKGVARELGVRYVIQGSVRRHDDRVRLRLAMIDGATGVQSWGEQFEIDRAQLAQSLDDIKGGLARTLVIELGKSAGRAIRAMAPEQVAADDLAMQGVAVLLRGLSRENFAEAGQLFDQAVAKDPQSTRGLAGVSLVNSMGVIFQWLPDRASAIARAEAALDRLEAIDATGYMTLDARATLINLRGDWPSLLLAAENMIRAFPTDATAHHHRCSALLRLGRFEESIVMCERSLRISPRDSRVPIWHGLIGMNHFMEQRYERAAESARHPVAALPHLPFYWLLLTAALEQGGNATEARRVLGAFRNRHPGFDTAAGISELWPATQARFVAGRDEIAATIRRLER